ncbi:hypothetical protein [Aromatoleum aromaticum]|uniref:hypothetical protein n=3 Tax=Aromatoleum aromaticum TaxID=551760 RepID=UPI00203BB098|nr:hypothetical protein [Aromatoleum aromaticum]
MTKLIHWRKVTPTPGPVDLVFAHYRPSVDLVFARPVDPTPGPVALVFGAYTPPLYPTITATVAASLPPTTLPGLTLAAVGDQVASATVIDATLAATLPAPTLPGITVAALDATRTATVAASLPAPALPALAADAAGVQDLDLITDVGPGLRAPAWPHTPPAALGLVVRQQPMQPARTPMRAHEQSAARLATACATAQQQMTRAGRRSRIPAQHARSLGHGTALPHTDTIKARRPVQLRARHATPAGQGARAAHHERIRTRRALSTHHAHAIPATARARAGHHQARPTATPLAAPHAHMLPLPVGWWQATYPWPEPPPGVQYSSPVQLVFCRAADGTTRLVFGCPPATGGTVVIPIQECYVVINSFSLVRADTGEPVDVQDFSASLDADSWCWGWSASLPAASMPLVRSPAIGDHVELVATLNGTPLHLVVERLARDRRFGEAWLKVSGRGRAAWLADPHAPVATRYNATARTARQLLDDALMVNGVSIGWDLDWRVTDWLVPAGSWSHTGTYMDAATRIAEAAGAYVQAHDTDQTLIILPRYPVAPWHWPTQTPDIDLPEDVCEVEGIEWQDKPAYNAVWIAGGEAGRRDRIRRAGTAADRNAQTIVDPLATDPAMTLQRGTAALGDTGRQAHITLRLPVLPETGIIRPGKLVRYTESGTARIGISRAVQIEQRFPELWQSIRLETHEHEPV